MGEAVDRGEHALLDLRAESLEISVATPSSWPRRVETQSRSVGSAARPSQLGTVRRVADPIYHGTAFMEPCAEKLSTRPVDRAGEPALEFDRVRSLVPPRA